MADNSTFLTGATVVISAKTSEPGSATPASPSRVFLGALTLGTTPPGTPVAVASKDFTLVAEGSYELRLDTTGLAAGTYRYQVVAVLDGGAGTGIVEDSFVLAASMPTVP